MVNHFDFINFRKLEEADFDYMFKWLNQDIVMKWYSKKNWTMEDVIQKYRPYVNNEKPIKSYLIQYNNAPIGYIQTYHILSQPDYTAAIDLKENAAGLDLFIGEQDYIHRGLGKDIIRKFLADIIFTENETVSCLIGPEPTNLIAIKAYEKVGFEYIKTIQIEEDEEYMMRISREEFLNF